MVHIAQNNSRCSRLIGGWSRVYDRRRRFATLTAAALAIALGYHVVFGRNGLTAYANKRQNSVDLDNQLGALTHENDQLKAHVDRLQNDPGSIEHQAREELHYTRAGEVIYTLPITSSASTPVK